MTAHEGPPPGYTTIRGVCERLDMSRQNFYQTGLNEILNGWQVASNAPILYRLEDVAIIRYWLFTRRGLIALGILSDKEPLARPFDKLEAMLDEDYHGGLCPKCEGEAVVDWDTSRVWCPEHGVQLSKAARRLPGN